MLIGPAILVALLLGALYAAPWWRHSRRRRWGSGPALVLSLAAAIVAVLLMFGRI
jgi:hypothetical protein